MFGLASENIVPLVDVGLRYRRTKATFYDKITTEISAARITRFFTPEASRGFGAWRVQRQQTIDCGRAELPQLNDVKNEVLRRMRFLHAKAATHSRLRKQRIASLLL